MTEIRLRRQGVALCERAWFAPCSHGHGWHIQIDERLDGVLVELSYPNCHECFGATFELPSEPDPDEYVYLSEHVEDHQKWARLKQEHSASIRSGQVAASNRETYRHVKSIGEGRAVATAMIQWKVGPDFVFAGETEAYMCYSEADYRAYPYLERDIFIAACWYDEGSNCIVTPQGDLVSFVRHDSFEVHWRAEAYPKEIKLAEHEYMKAHVQRDGEVRAKTWFAWLLSEYIKDVDPGVETVIRSRMIERS